MKRPSASLFGAASALVLMVSPSLSNDRYAERPPVMVSPDLSAPWVMQLGHAPGVVRPVKRAPKVQHKRVQAVEAPAQVQVQPDRIRTSAVPKQKKRVVRR
jgi:hypothetical protein